MKLVAFLILLALLGIYIVLSSLAMMQARRFKNLSRTNKIATWTYITVASTIGIGIIISFFTIEF